MGDQGKNFKVVLVIEFIYFLICEVLSQIINMLTNFCNLVRCFIDLSYFYFWIYQLYRNNMNATIENYSKIFSDKNG